MGRSVRVWAGISVILALSACIVEARLTPGLAPAGPPEIEFAGLVTDVKLFDDRYEFTDVDSIVHTIGIDEYRQLGAFPCCRDLVVLGNDADGKFLVTFRLVEGLPLDCHVGYDFGVDRGSHIELFGVLWRKAPGFQDAVPVDTEYMLGTRFCFDTHGRVASFVAP